MEERVAGTMMQSTNGNAVGGRRDEGTYHPWKSSMLLPRLEAGGRPHRGDFDFIEPLSPVNKYFNASSTTTTMALSSQHRRNGDDHIASDSGTKFTVEQQQKQKHQEREELTLKDRLLTAQTEYQELQQDCNFYRVKVKELTEILQIQKSTNENGSNDETPQQRLVQKSIQNAELSNELDCVKKELSVANAEISKFGSQREQNKRILLELSSIVYALKSVQVDYNQEEDPSLTASNAAGKKDETGKDMDDVCRSSLRNVKTKVDHIMEDRRILELRCQELEQENAEKDDKIAALEAQFHLLNSMNHITQNNGHDTKNASECNKESRHSTSHTTPSTVASQSRRNDNEGGDTYCELATTTSYAPFFLNRSTSFTSTNTKTSTLTPHTSSGGTDFDLKVIQIQNSTTPSQNNINANADTLQKQHLSNEDTTFTTDQTTTRGSISPLSPYQYKNNFELTSSASSMNKIKNLEGQVQSLKSQLEESKEQHRNFKEVCQTAFTKMKTVEQEFNDLQEECQEACRKRDELKDYVKDVILQYKELNGDYENALAQLEDAQSQVKELETVYSELREEKMKLEEYGADILEEDGLADNTETLKMAYLVARQKLETLEEKLKAANRVVEESKKKRANSGRDYRDAVAQSRRLEHEMKIMETRVAQSEHEVELAKKETMKFKEEAKHQRRRLTAYMRGKGIPTQTKPVERMDMTLMMPELQ